MKKLTYLFISLLATTFFVSCTSNDDEPEPVNEEELITTLKVTLTGGGEVITLQFKDLDGDGGNAPVYTVSGNLKANTTYQGTTQFLNESVNPADDITEEVEEEGAAHQVFYQLSNGLGALSYTTTNNDANGKPIGTDFMVQTNATTGTATFIVTLKHLPNKSAAGLTISTPNLAGGSTDAEAVFTVTVVNN